MIFDELVIDEDSLEELVADLERSFDVMLPEDLSHIRTAGDLFDEILDARTPSYGGDRGPVAMIFFVLRRLLADHGFDRRLRPATPLSGWRLTPPRYLRRRIANETGLAMPPATISRGAFCAIAGLICAGIFFFATERWLLLLIAVLAGIVTARFDPGGWRGDWATPARLSRAVAARNVVWLEARGARSTEADWWHAYVYLLAEHKTDWLTQVSCDMIGRETGLRFA